MGALRVRLREAGTAFRGVFVNPDLRRLQLAFVGSELGDWVSVIAVAVFAYDAGGAAAVGLVGLVRLLPAAVGAPFTAVLADTFPRQRVMLTADLLRAAAMAGASVAAFGDAPAPLIYAIVSFVSLVATAFRPAQSALLPTLAQTPEELTAANVTSSTTESVAAFGGPALGGALLAATSTGTAFAVTACTFLWSALLLSRIRKTKEPREERAESLASTISAGFRTILGERDLRLLVGLFAAQTLVYGALSVLLVVSALELLDLGESGLGYLYSALGVGGVVGAIVSTSLVGRRRLATAFGIAVVAWGAPIALLGAVPHTAAAIAFLALVGAANTVVDVAGLTLLQRAVPDEVLSRVFGVLESLVLATVALGAVIAPALVSGVGARGALAITGALLPVVTLLSWRRLRAMDEGATVPRTQLSLLLAQPLFAPLPGPVVEQLAGNLEPVGVAAGEDVVREGDVGDRFYVVADGELDVRIDGRPDRRLGAGDHFGEIALLRDVPRTATVTARTDAHLYALGRDEFIAAVTGHAGSAEAADAVIASRLAYVRPGVAAP
ncbi:MAG TPA: MFS transporter [Gaiellaceae bacterium]